MHGYNHEDHTRIIKFVFRLTTSLLLHNITSFAFYHVYELDSK